MTTPNSALYRGEVTHSRIRSRSRVRAHALAYRVFSLLLDLDEIDALGRRLRLFSRNRFNLFSFHDRDHGDGTETPLRAQVEGHLAAAGLGEDLDSIRLLAMPRILGYAFNPLSVYFCFGRGGSLLAILYEVNNTFGQRHSYLLPVGAAAGTIRQSCQKRFYVSPFQAMAMTYTFRIVPPGEKLVVAIAGRDAEGPAITAVLAARRAPLTDGGLVRAGIAMPLLTLKVIAAIHWDALLIWAKGGRFHPRPVPPTEAVTIGVGARRIGEATNA
jgi:DUF1365 family protein